VPSLGIAPPETIPALQRLVDEGAAEAGRDPTAIRRIYNVSGRIVDGPEEGLLQGPVDHWVQTLRQFVLELGFDTFIFWPGVDPLVQIERFASEVVPAVRDAVAVKRNA
jgi:hypothetical protein